MLGDRSRQPATLCASCQHARELRSRTGSVFTQCRRGLEDKRYPKYPPQPVLRCPGYERASESDKG